MGRQSHKLQGETRVAVVFDVHFRIIKSDGKDDENFHYMLNHTERKQISIL